MLTIVEAETYCAQSQRGATKVASPIPHDLLTAREVADVMRVSTMTVYRLIKAGEMPAIRVGKHLRIRERDVARYLDERVVGLNVEGGSDQWPVA